MSKPDPFKEALSAAFDAAFESRTAPAFISYTPTEVADFRETVQNAFDTMKVTDFKTDDGPSWKWSLGEKTTAAGPSFTLTCTSVAKAQMPYDGVQATNAVTLGLIQGGDMPGLKGVSLLQKKETVYFSNAVLVTASLRHSPGTEKTTACSLDSFRQTLATWCKEVDPEGSLNIVRNREPLNNRAGTAPSPHK